MSREIKFRGFYKFNDHAEWVYGYYFCDKSIDHHGIYLGEKGSRNVDGKSIGQYTGLKDKNRVEIYEGDILRCKGGEYSQGYSEYDVIGVVTFSKSASFDVVTKDEVHCSFGYSDWHEIQILGNIYENPELISKEAVKA